MNTLKQLDIFNKKGILERVYLSYKKIFSPSPKNAQKFCAPVALSCKVSGVFSIFMES